MRRTSRSFWILVTLVLAVAFVFGGLALALIALELGVNGFVAGFLMAVVPVPFYIAFALWIDRFESEPAWLLAVAFVWGASISVFFSMIVNSINEGIYEAVAGPASASIFGAVVSAPLVEELAKGFALLILFLAKRDEFDNVTDGIVYAFVVGLGFAMTENVLYYGRAVAEPNDPVAIFFLRGVMGPYSHPLFTSMTGIGLGIARETSNRSVRWLAPLVGLAGAIVLHAIWNLSATLGAVFFAAYLVVMMPAFLGVGIIALFSLRRETRVIRAHLEGVVAEGILTAEDLTVVTSVRRRIGASARALLTGGMRTWKARRRFHALTTELAFHAWRGSRDGAHDRAMHDAIVAEIVRVRAALG